MEKHNNQQTIIIQNNTNSAATAAFVLGIIGLVIGFIPYIGWFMAPVWVLAIVLGLIGMRKQYKRGMSLAGLIFGLLGAAYKIGFWIIAAGGLIAALSGSGDNSAQNSPTDTYSKFVENVNALSEDSTLNWVLSTGEKNVFFYPFPGEKKELMLGLNYQNGGDDLHIAVKEFDKNQFKGKVVDTPPNKKKWLNQQATVEKIDGKTIKITIGEEKLTMVYKDKN
ncbi:DUF4190 domain-containing protein [Bacillus cereus]|uniref:DUF4190 domain-containing protein n=1 Tax=Bacillus cereus TaxID=1396 RepID=UPI00196AD1E3|nr:DUF4190 domain-containing protein [Bacillus cereus]